MNHVIDACAMIAYLRGEHGADALAQLLKNPQDRCFAHAINVCEVYYDFIRSSDEKTARAAIQDLKKVGIVVRRDMSSAFWMKVGQLKGTVKKISLADCFAVVLSRHVKADVVTSDHAEFQPLLEKNICAVTFIR